MTLRVAVLHFTPPGVVGGVEQIMERHANLLGARGVDVSFVAGRASQSNYPCIIIPELDAASPDGAKIEAELADGAVTHRFHTARSAVLNALLPILRRTDALIVHNAFTLHFSLPATAALWEIAGARSVPVILSWTHDLAWVNRLYVLSMHTGYPWELLRTPAPHVRYITISHERKAELTHIWRDGGPPVQVVPNGVDALQFLRVSSRMRDVVQRFHLLESDILIVLPVRITRRKNIQIAVQVVHELKQRGLKARLIVSGPQAPHHPDRSNSYLAELLELRARFQLENDVIFLAHDVGEPFSEEEVAELCALCDCLLFPSESEGFGLPILEAGIAGLPVVLSDIPVFREVGADDALYFSLQSSPSEVADVLLRAIDTPAARLRRRARGDFAWDAIVERSLLPMLLDEPERDYRPSA